MLNFLRLRTRWFAWFLLAKIKPNENEIDEALRHGFSTCGLSLDNYYPEYNLLETNKLYEVLIHSSRKLGNPLVTVEDVKRLLS